MSCRDCGFSNPANFRFCGQCGGRLGEVEAERRQLTVMFFDLVGSTTLSSELDPEELRELVRAYQTRCNSVVRRYGGHVAQFLGDGILVYFGYPEAHSDDGWRAVSCALSIIQAMEELNRELTAHNRPRLDLRVGMHTGLVVVGELGSAEHRENLAIGETPNVAARLQGLAGINQVVLSAATYELVGDAFEVEELGLHSLKGVPEPVPVYRAAGWRRLEGPDGPPGPAGPLVGREQALQALQQLWQAAVGPLAQGCVVELLAESGLGKTRLLQEFTGSQLAGSPLVLRCYPERQYCDSPWWVASAVLERVLELSDPELTRTERLLRVLAEQAPELSLHRAYPVLRRLLRSEPLPEYPDPVLSPGAWRKLTTQTLRELGSAVAARRPWLIVVDGGENVDPSSLAWLQEMTEALRGTRAMIVVAAQRSVVSGSLPRIYLERLETPQARALVQHLAPALSSSVVEQVLERADGVPLFLEQLARLALKRPGETLPARLRDFFTARLDSLGSAKRHAQLASVIGRRFSRRLLAQLLEAAPEQLHNGIRELVEHEVVLASASRDELVFRHALMREACYESLLKAVRQTCHTRLAALLEQQFSTWCTANPSVVAYHWEHSSSPERAIPWLAQALTRCLAVSALQEATRISQQAIRLLDRIEPGHPYQEYRLRFLTLCGTAWIGLRGYAAPEVAECYGAARQICEQLGDVLDVFPVLAGLWALYLVQGRLNEADELVVRLQALAENGDALHRRLATALSGQTRFFRGELRAARQDLEKAVASYVPGMEDGQALAYLLTEPSIASASYLSWCLFLLDQGPEAERVAIQALQWARALDHPHTLAHTLFFEAWLRLNLGQLASAA